MLPMEGFVKRLAISGAIALMSPPAIDFRNPGCQKVVTIDMRVVETERCLLH
jgi:hypothetical protein